MTTTIQAPFKINGKDESSIRDRIGKLDKYNAKISQVNVYFKEDDGTRDGVIKAQIRVFLPGPDIFVSKEAPQVMKAFGEAFEIVRRELRQKVDKRAEDHNDVSSAQDLFYDKD